MSATTDLIAAALTAAELMEGMIGESYRPVGQMLREACARAMVQPEEVVELLDRLESAETAWRVTNKSCYDLTEKVIPSLRDQLEAAEKERGHEKWLREQAEDYSRAVDYQRDTLLDYVRGVMAERDALCAVHAGATKKMARDERQLFESWIVRECGPGETKRWLNTEAYENMRVNDYRTGWAACLGLMSAASNPVSAAEVPMPEPSLLSPETIDGYQHVYPMWNELTMHAYGDAREAAGYAAGVAAVRDYAVMRWCAEVSNRPLVNTHRRTLDDTWRQVIRHTGGDPETLIGPCHDVLVALRGEVKP